MTDESYLTRKLRYGAELGAEDVEYLDRMVRGPRNVAANTSLIEEGEDTEYVHVIMSGVACRYKMMPDGGRAILALLLPGDFCDLHVAILDYMDHSIGTLVECEVAVLPRQTVNEMLDRPAINRACWWATLADEAVLREWLVNVGKRSADKQLAHLFCELYVRMNAVGLTTDHTFRMPFTQATLGDLIGATQVHVQRMMTRLRDDGLITLQDRMISFPDYSRLAEFAEFDPAYLHLGRVKGDRSGVGHGRATV